MKIQDQKKWYKGMEFSNMLKKFIGEILEKRNQIKLKL